MRSQDLGGKQVIPRRFRCLVDKCRIEKGRQAHTDRSPRAFMPREGHLTPRERCRSRYPKEAGVPSGRFHLPSRPQGEKRQPVEGPVPRRVYASDGSARPPPDFQSLPALKVALPRARLPPQPGVAPRSDPVPRWGRPLHAPVRVRAHPRGGLRTASRVLGETARSRGNVGGRALNRPPSSVVPVLANRSLARAPLAGRYRRRRADQDDRPKPASVDPRPWPPNPAGTVPKVGPPVRRRSRYFHVPLK
jgi:hypothetical protein